MRPCVCPRARHVHGTVRAFVADHCRCDPCRRAHARWMKRGQVRRDRIGSYTLATFAPSIGTARRLQALAAVGWACADLAPILHARESNVCRWRVGRQALVTARTAAKVSAVYDALWDRPPTGRYTVKVRNLAARRGWQPPAAYDDDLIDDPAASPSTPDTGAWDLKPCGTPAAYRRHYRRGEVPCRVCVAAERRRHATRNARRRVA